MSLISPLKGLAAAYVVAEKPHRKTIIPQPPADGPRWAAV
jgi:hypothetical protein